MTIEVLAKRGVPGRAIARTLGVDEKTVRYRLARRDDPRPDGRSKSFAAEAFADVIGAWMERHSGRGRNVAALYDHLVAEHDYPGSYKSVQRYVRARYPRPRRRARRRVETPPGAQGQVDWAEYPEVWIAGRREALAAFHLELGYSRHGAVIWSRSNNQLAWLWAHNEAFRRLGGVPAVLRIDNVKTAIVHGAGAWGEIHPVYRRSAQTVRFHVDACAPRAPQAKGKVERWIGDGRRGADPRERHWNDLGELQAWSDGRVLARSRRRRCPATGTSVSEAFEREQPHLGALPILPEPFDVVVTRPVGRDCLVAFEGRSYSVPFRYVGQRVEVRGCAGRVQVLADARIVAVHARGTDQRLLIDPAHFEGKATDTVLPPLPLGRMGIRLAEIAALAPERRPLDLYAALAEVAR